MSCGIAGTSALSFGAVSLAFPPCTVPSGGCGLSPAGRSAISASGFSAFGSCTVSPVGTPMPCGIAGALSGAPLPASMLCSAFCPASLISWPIPFRSERCSSSPPRPNPLLLPSAESDRLPVSIGSSLPSSWLSILCPRSRRYSFKCGNAAVYSSYVYSFVGSISTHSPISASSRSISAAASFT